MKPGMQRDPEVYHFMPECQHHDYQNNNYILRACSGCCRRYNEALIEGNVIDVYVNNVLTSHGSVDRPPFSSHASRERSRSHDDSGEMGTETRMDPDPPQGLNLVDLSDVPRRRRVEYVQDIMAKPKAGSRWVNVPKPAPIEPRPKQNSRVVLEPNPQPAESTLTMPVAPRSPASTIRSTEWDNVSETNDMHASLQAHLRDSEREWY